MKLTTQRLKKLIREELEKMNEGFGELVPELKDIEKAAEGMGMEVGGIQAGYILPLYSNPEEDTFDGEADLYVQYKDDGSYECQNYGYMGGKKTPCPTKEDVIKWLQNNK
jgi:hypothetical protein